MKLSVSTLGIINNQELINKLNIDKVDFIHLDVMDGIFVNNKKIPDNKINYNKKLDIHLMCKKLDEYIEYYKILNPEYITFHYEIGNTLENIEKIKLANSKVGIAINPNTDIDVIFPYLNKIDLVLIMSVEPGLGGQTFINSTFEKISKLKKYKETNNLSFLIEVDGGINDSNIKKIDLDMVVVGSYITSSINYEKSIEKLVIE